MNKKRKSGKDVAKTPHRTLTKKRKIKDLLIVGIGASAGGLDAFRRLVKQLPLDTGMAFVMVQHLDPSHESSLTKIISAATKLAVIEAADGMVIEPNCIFVMPSNADMSLSGNTIRLTGRSETVPHLPIDSFFNSLAQEHRANAMGVILSGTASDGTIGLKRIKSEGGITFAQDEVSAKYAGMPRSAARAGGADFIMSPEKIAAHLTKIAKQRGNARPRLKKSESKPARTAFTEIQDILHQATGVDFSHYRITTMERRIRRRMLVNNQEKISDYVAYLRKHKSEIDLLYKDIFIHVTSFFRNPEKFETLRSKVLPQLLGNRPESPWRIWVAGCSSGEEVYSLAIVILEFLASRRTHGRVQIFATDISESEIQKARTGVYSKEIEKDVSAKRLKKFFDKIDGNYKITKSIRELCVFARHDLTKDPPFSRMDLISCSNVLIYLEPAMQQKVLSTFHVSLKPSAFLLLGKSESTGKSSHLFELVDKKSRVYSKRTAPRVRLPLPVGRKSRATVGEGKDPEVPFDWQKEADHIVLTRYKHAGFLVDDSMKILAFRGLVSPFLEPVAGEASLELTKMVRKDLRTDLRALLQNARKTMKPVRKENIPFRFDGEERTVIAETIPIRDPDSKQCVFLLTLEETRSTEVQNQKIPVQKGVETAKDRLIADLNNQIGQINQDTRVSIEQLERLNEELTSTNEELQSAMEELQSTNEEYESAKEQLESANEELVTLNEELQTSNTELDHVNLELTETRDYARAIIRTVREPLVILDSGLRISSANDAFYRTFNISRREAEHAYFFDIKDRLWDVPLLRSKIASILRNEIVLEDVEIEQDFPHLGYRTMCLNVRRVVQRKRKGDVLILLAIEDITARRQQEETSSTLMKEIHHRVKNNLMVIISLLNLQSGVLQDEEAVAAFKDSRDRVKSIALIHEKMYESAQIGKVSFRNYLNELMNHLFKLYVKDSTKLELDLNVEDVYLDMDQAVPCGLIANELLSNALKYAFPENRPGKIDIQVISRVLRGKNQPPREYVLTIKDNGVGLPAEIDTKNAQSMGMRIVSALTRQLEGKLEVIREEGTHFRVTFPAPRAL